jgi:hypothetical protein
MMWQLFFNTVVVRIAIFPSGLRFGAWAHMPQKRLRTGRKECNITWGYVTRNG